MSRRALPGQTGDHLTAGFHKILQVFTDGLFVTQIVILLHQTVEQRLVRRAAHLYKLQRSDARQWPAYWTVVRDHGLRLLPLRDPIAYDALHRRQLDLARTVEHQQQSAANHVAQRAIGLLPLPGFTELARQLPAAQLRMVSDELPDESNLFAGDFAASIAMCSHLIRSVPESVSER